MRNLDELWRKRSTYNRQEVQKYMRFVFTGHMALVIVFLLGAGIFQYSHFLDAYRGNSAIPTTLITVVVVAFFVTLSRPKTLIKKPDEVYLLPLETKLMTYFKHALVSTYTSQVVVSALLFIVMWPMLRQIGLLPISTIVIGLVSVFILKWLNVQQEFTYRWVTIGHRVWLDRLIRFVLNGGILYTLLENQWIVAVVLVIVFVAYFVYYKKKLVGQPFPYEHFVPVEANRMMGIYRFANYFTNVPQVHGSIKRRPYFDFIYKLVPKTHQQTFAYYLFRSVLRTDDHFYLWLRLVAINGLVVAFVDLPLVSIIVCAALSFAVAIQLKQALGSTHEFTMGMLYPLKADARKKAAIQIGRYMIIAHAIIVLLCGIMQPYFYVYALVVLIVGELTLRLSK